MSKCPCGCGAPLSNLPSLEEKQWAVKQAIKKGLPLDLSVAQPHLKYFEAEGIFKPSEWQMVPAEPDMGSKWMLVNTYAQSYTFKGTTGTMQEAKVIYGVDVAGNAATTMPSDSPTTTATETITLLDMTLDPGQADLEREDFKANTDEFWVCTAVVGAGGLTCGNNAAWQHTMSGAGICKAHWDTWNGTPTKTFRPAYTTKKKTYSNWDNAKSQKAKGIGVIAEVYMGDSDTLITNNAAKSASLWTQGSGTPNFPVFARPCPKRPRHGFIDSRLVKTQADWDKLLAEIAACDEPDAEIICMPYLDAEWSGILTPKGLTIGPGNDGATSGHDSLTIPVESRDLLRHLGIRAADCGIKEAAYLELVCPKTPYSGLNGVSPSGRPELVQVRDGPLVNLTDRSIPFAVTVTEVVEAGGDLTKWEARAKKFTPGTVVWHPGGNLASHYAVHCINNNVPILCTKEAPKVGEVLAVANEKPKLSDDDYKTIAGYMAAMAGSIGSNYEQMSQWCELGTAVLHGSSLWGNEPHLLRLRGTGVGAIMMLGGAAVLGELRHYYTHGPGRKGIKARCQGITFTPPTSARSVERLNVFREALDLDVLNLTAAVRAAYYDFNQGGWQEGMGGRKWAACAGATLMLMQAVGDFLANPNEKTYAKVMVRLNRIIHVSHNGGLFLNKFMSTEKFSYLSDKPVLGFLSTTAFNVAYGNKVARRDVTSDFAKNLRDRTVRPRGEKAKAIAHHTGKPVPGDAMKYSGPLGTFKAVVQVPKNSESSLIAQMKMKKTLNQPYGARIHIAEDMIDAATRKSLQSFEYNGEAFSGSYYGDWAACMATITDNHIVFTQGQKSVTFPISACLWS